MADEFIYEVKEDGPDIVLEETANQSTNLRMVRYGNGDFKVDIRRWFYKDGEEKMGKGITLSTDGANELTVGLISEGFGDTRKIIDAVKDREDFRKNLNESLDNVTSISSKYNADDEDDEEEAYYDPMQLIS